MASHFHLLKPLDYYLIPQSLGANIRCNSHTDFFNTLIGVLRGETLAPFLLVIILDYILRNCMSSDYGLTIHLWQSLEFQL